MTDLQMLLKETNPFAHFDEPRLAEITSLAHRRRFDKGEFVTLHGELWPNLILVREGTLHAVKESEEGRNLVVLTLTEGDVFWGLSFFDKDSAMPVSLQSVKSGSLVSWSRDDLLPYLIANGEALWSLCGLLVMRMKQASNIVDSLAFQPVAGRLANLMLERYGGTGDDPVARDLTLDTMAAYVGTTREMVCRILYRFSDEKLIHITRTEFSITDQEGLSALAGPHQTG
ncbi:MAG: Crp/Fnr family transcriptional regulator [Chloroflexota bacterium]|nr:Crp/Fnr family transcriptional regulator [Chloroflexota bacterium]